MRRHFDFHRDLDVEIDMHEKQAPWDVAGFRCYRASAWSIDRSRNNEVAYVQLRSKNGCARASLSLADIDEIIVALARLSDEAVEAIAAVEAAREKKKAQAASKKRASSAARSVAL